MSTVFAKPSRKYFLLIIACLVFIWLLCQLPTLKIFVADDFVAYWASSRLLLEGKDPYNEELLLLLQRKAGWSQTNPFIPLTPPWTLTLLLPFGALDYWASRLIWFVISLILILFFADWAWFFFEGPRQHRWMSWLGGIFFYPVLFNLKLGQITPLLLIGLWAFVEMEGKKRYWWAGFFSVLLTIKPQTMFLFWVAAFLWVLHKKKWNFLWGFLSGLLILALVPMVFFPAVYSSYWGLGQTHVLNPGTPTLGSILRLSFGEQPLFLQFIPSLLGIIWGIGYWITYRKRWDWPKELPLLILVSLLTASYGWIYDQVLLVFVLMQCAIALYGHGRDSRKTLLILGYFFFNLAAMSQNLLGFKDIYYTWMMGGWIILYFLCLRITSPESSHSTN
jgi:hypothetical protein